MARVSIARSVAVSFAVTESWSAEELSASAHRMFSSPQYWLRSLAERVIQQFPGPPPLAVLEKFIATDNEFRLAVKLKNIKSLRLGKLLRGKPLAAVFWKTPPIKDSRRLAKWLGLTDCELDWLANLSIPRTQSEPSRTRHYVYTWIRKRSTGQRLIESPKIRLKQVQRQILHGLLSQIHPHPAANGFCPGRNVLTYVQPHVAHSFCLKMDLKDFFPSIQFGRIQGLFRSAGYSKEVARYLAALCSNAVDHDTIFRANCAPYTGASEISRLYMPRHLPQGAPTSPAIANLIAYRFDARLTGLAEWIGASYTRYADDLLFSGGSKLARSAKRFATSVAAIAIEEGFQVQFRKTRFMHAAQRQQAAGVVINERTNLPRAEFDRLKAILFNCLRSGPESQNREGHPNFREHLQGRIEWASQLNPKKAEKLRAMFARIEWTGSGHADGT